MFFVYLVGTLIVASIGLIVYYSRILDFMNEIVHCELASRAVYYPPTRFRLFLISNLQFRIRRVGERYGLEFRTFLTGWRTIPSSTLIGAEQYGRWYEPWVYDLESVQRRLTEVQDDISKWHQVSKSIDYTQYNSRVIETIKYKKDGGV